MHEDQLRELFEQVRQGAVDVEAALTRVRHLPFEDLGFAKVDHHRALRHGMPEVIFAKGTTPQQTLSIAESLLEWAPNVLITRADRETAEIVLEKLTCGEYLPLSGAIRFWRDKTVRGKGKITVVCAGTSDMPVAEEAQITAEVMGNDVEAIHDIGVAGIHRLMSMPTSVGYGASFYGLAALLGMLNSCASNVTVVNIDNGFGAGYVASLINRL